MERYLNWSYIANAVVGDMTDDEEYEPVRVRTSDGKVWFVTAVGRDGEGRVEMRVEDQPRERGAK